MNDLISFKVKHALIFIGVALVMLILVLWLIYHAGFSDGYNSAVMHLISGCGLCNEPKYIPFP